jgi:putrescine transport system ATP-binding protein
VKNHFLDIQSLQKSFGRERVLEDVNLQLKDHSTLSLVGASGSGKTTLLKIIAGLEKADGGKVILDGQPMNKLPPQERKIVYLYQDALLFPHLSAFENLAFGLRLQKAKNINKIVENMLVRIGMEEHAQKMPNQLSGGQKQRIAFGRALVIKPRLLLLDEPFGALDPQIRQHMQKLFKNLMAEDELSAMFVTHDIKEAIIIGNDIAKIEKGNVQQYKTKQDFFNDEKSGVKEEIEFWKTINND